MPGIVSALNNFSTTSPTMKIPALINRSGNPGLTDVKY